MVKLELELSELDYGAMLERLLPMMGDQLRSSGNPLGMLLSNGMPTSMARHLLATVPQEQKDALLCDLINGNSAKMSKKAEQSAAKQGIHVKVERIHASHR